MKDFCGEIKFDLPLNEPLYIISVVSKIVGIPVWTLREIEKKGIVTPKRLGRKARLYTFEQVKKLEYIHYLMFEERVNLSGIKVILEIRENK